MKIAVGNSRMDKKWKNQDISWADLCARCGSTIRTTETVEEYRKLKKGQQDGIKDVGGFVGGHLCSTISSAASIPSTSTRRSIPGFVCSSR